MILAIDTITRSASIALYDASGVLAEESWRSGNNHTVEVLPAIVRLLERQGAGWPAVRAVAVSQGPGSFTGSRIGMSVAKGLCLALGIPLVAVPSLQVTAYAAGDPGCPVLAAVEAGRGRLCVARFAYSEGIPVQQGPTQLEAVNTWAPDLAEPVLLTGEIDAALAERLSALPGAENLAMVSPAGSLRRAGYLAELGWDRFQRGETDDLDTTEPLYLQQPLSGSA